MDYLADTMQGDFLFGADVSVADCYLFVMLLWAQKNGLEPPGKLATFRERMLELTCRAKGDDARGLDLTARSSATVGYARSAPHPKT